MDLERKSLYGGALTMHLPTNLLDLSTLREVPDNQEVYVDQLETDRSIIIELNQLVEQVQGSSFGRFHFIEYCTESTKSETPQFEIYSVEQVDLEHFPNLPKETQVEKVVGKQVHSSKSVYTLMLVLRLASITTDIVIVYHQPKQELEERDTLVGMELELKGMLASFTIEDWSLFG